MSEKHIREYRGLIEAPPRHVAAEHFLAPRVYLAIGRCADAGSAQGKRFSTDACEKLKSFQTHVLTQTKKSAEELAEKTEKARALHLRTATSICRESKSATMAMAAPTSNQ